MPNFLVLRLWQSGREKLDVPTATENLQRVYGLKVFRVNLGNFGQNILAPQNNACSYTIGLRRQKL